MSLTTNANVRVKLPAWANLGVNQIRASPLNITGSELRECYGYLKVSSLNQLRCKGCVHINRLRYLNLPDYREERIKSIARPCAVGRFVAKGSAEQLPGTKPRAKRPPLIPSGASVVPLLFMLGESPHDALHGPLPKRRKVRQESLLADSTPRPVIMGDDKKVMVLPLRILVERFFCLCLCSLPCSFVHTSIQEEVSACIFAVYSALGFKEMQICLFSLVLMVLLCYIQHSIWRHIPASETSPAFYLCRR